MPRSISMMLVHIIFRTKNRFPFIEPKIQPELHAYLATAVRTEGCLCYQAVGVSDHVHLAVKMTRRGPLRNWSKRSKLPHRSGSRRNPNDVVSSPGNPVMERSPWDPPICRHCENICRNKKITINTVRFRTNIEPFYINTKSNTMKIIFGIDRVISERRANGMPIMMR